MTKKRVFLFVVFVFLMTWLVEGPAALRAHGYKGFTAPRWIDIIATLSPGIVAIGLTIYYKGRKGLLDFFRQIKFRAPVNWYAFSLFCGGIVAGVSLIIFILITKTNIKLSPSGDLFFYLLLFLFFSPFWEELGWRGYLLPALQERMGALGASLLIGFIWGLWHLPYYFALNPYGGDTIYFYLFVFMGCFPMSIIQTWIYNSNKGNLLLCILFHDGMNAGIGYFFGSLPSREIRPFEITVVILIFIAVGIIWKTKGRLGKNYRVFVKR